MRLVAVVNKQNYTGCSIKRYLFFGKRQHIRLHIDGSVSVTLEAILEQKCTAGCGTKRCNPKIKTFCEFYVATMTKLCEKLYTLYVCKTRSNLLMILLNFTINSSWLVIIYVIINKPCLTCPMV